MYGIYIYIYLDLVDFYGKCAQVGIPVYQFSWMLWVRQFGGSVCISLSGLKGSHQKNLAENCVLQFGWNTFANQFQYYKSKPQWKLCLLHFFQGGSKESSHH